MEDETSEMMADETSKMTENELVEVSEVEIQNSFNFFEVREKFSPLKDFEMKLERYKKQTFVEYWTRDSRTIEGARRRGIVRPIKSELHYYEVKYCCIQGGEEFKAKGKGKRCTS